MSAPVDFVLREYALLADGERGALVDPHGNVAWLCAPQWHDPALFSLLGGRSSFAVTPTERFVWGGYYEPGTLIWRSRWVTQDGIIECREALALPARSERLVLLRRVHAVDGAAQVRVALRPRVDYDRRALRLRRDERGVWRGASGALHLTVSGLPEARQRDGLHAELRLAPGEHHDLVLSAGAESEPPDPERLWAGTEAAWRQRVPRMQHTLAERDAQHALAVLHGLTSTGGGMVAAATMSLPERARQGRSYDYRYVWIRDQCYAGEAAAAAEAPALLDDALAFVRERVLADGPHLSPAYTVNGGRVPDEGHAGLPGYPGGADITGNWVNSQFQLDAWGEVLLLFAAGRRRDRLDADHWRAAQCAVDTIESRWREPDAGLWELEPALWTHSRLICVAGLRALTAAAPDSVDVSRWSALADAIMADCSRRSLHPDGRWQRSPDDPRIDASLLLAALRGAVPAHDPRSLATLDATLRELATDHYMYRFRPDERPLGEAEGAFLLCGAVGRPRQRAGGPSARGVRWFERGRTACGTPGLFAEEYDVTQRQLRGNLPQAFVHALMLECAATLNR